MMSSDRANRTDSSFLHPRNVGEVANVTSRGQTGSVECGSVLRITLQIENQQITDAKFKLAGCSLLVAACSLLTEKVKGKSAADAALYARAFPGAVEAEFGISPGREHCAILASECLLSAIQNYSDSVRAEWVGDDVLICSCFGVSEKTIEDEVQSRGLISISDVTDACNAGGGCRSCYPLIQDILDSLSNEVCTVTR
jgi:NifU-like protein